jgi:hypothetical protein
MSSDLMAQNTDPRRNAFIKRPEIINETSLINFIATDGRVLVPNIGF